MTSLVERLRWWGAKRKPPKGMDTLPDDCREAADEIERLRKALEPFANAVFNDNGDMTVDRSFATYDDFVRAYFVLKEARAALAAVKEADNV